MPSCSPVSTYLLWQERHPWERLGPEGNKMCSDHTVTAGHAGWRGAGHVAGPLLPGDAHEAA